MHQQAALLFPSPPSLSPQHNLLYVETIANHGAIDPAVLEKAYFDFYTTGTCRSGCYLVRKTNSSSCRSQRFSSDHPPPGRLHPKVSG